MDTERDPLQKERDFLNQVYHTYTVDHSAQTMTMRRLIMRTFAPYVRGGHGLELGCSDGFMTEMIASRVETLDVVDGSEKFIAEAGKRNLANVRYQLSLFEEFRPDRTYDCVFASYILEHVLDPVAVMRMARSVVKPGGYIFIVVPNARALSRQLALHMGLLQDLKTLTPNDLNHGHRRVYDRVNLNRDIEAAGWVHVSQGGIMLKILADFQLDRLIDDLTLQEAQIDGLYRLGAEYPDLCGSLFSVCTPAS